MGCRNSRTEGERPKLTPGQKALVADSWKELHIDLERIGMLMFMGMFDTHPETKRYFDFEDKVKATESTHSENIQRLREHGLRFMSLVKKLLCHIDKKEKFDNMLLELGRRHHGYQANVDFFAVFGECFIHSIRPTLKHSWNPKVEEAWTQLFKYISYMMKRGMLQQEKRDKKKTSVK
ncbi:neuroglobin-2-like [Ptychodera flava]|uniref:neuroglobin-2-like n=1 Tax=Ptychodera flava TaxID=63121 RepID=UPI00396A8AB9